MIVDDSVEWQCRPGLRQAASMGMAATGRRAVADTKMLADLMLEATSALVEQASKLRCIGLSGGATSVPMVLRAPHGDTRSNGPHHAGAYYPIYAHCPGFIVVVPAFAADAKGLFKTALRFAQNPVRPAAVGDPHWHRSETLAPEMRGGRRSVIFMETKSRTVYKARWDKR